MVNVGFKIKPGKQWVKLPTASSTNALQPFQPTEEPLGCGVMADANACWRSAFQRKHRNFCQLHQGQGFQGLVRASIHGNVSVELSSFTGVDWRILFAGIGPAIRNFSFVLPEELKGRLTALYEDFYELMLCMVKKGMCLGAGFHWNGVETDPVHTTFFEHDIFCLYLQFVELYTLVDSYVIIFFDCICKCN